MIAIEALVDAFVDTPAKRIDLVSATLARHCAVGRGAGDV